MQRSVLARRALCRAALGTDSRLPRGTCISKLARPNESQSSKPKPNSVLGLRSLSIAVQIKEATRTPCIRCGRGDAQLGEVDFVLWHQAKRRLCQRRGPRQGIAWRLVVLRRHIHCASLFCLSRIALLHWHEYCAIMAPIEL